MPNLLSSLFKTSLSAFRAAIVANNTNRICRILDVRHHYINKELDGAGNTPLIFAIKYASPLTVQLLLKQGAQPDLPHCVTCQTPLSILTSTTYDDEHTREAKIAFEMATLLLDHDAYVDKPSSFTYTDQAGVQYDIKETPLMTAVRTRNLALATLLIDRKANVNYIEKQSNHRPVHLAVLNGDEAMFDLLESAGASCRSVVSDGNNTLLHCFCTSKTNDEQQSLLQKLVKVGCDVNAENDQQRTALMLAAKLNMVRTCEMLLRCRAETERVDCCGQRAIDVAELGSECFRLLLHTAQLERSRSRAHQRTDRLVCKKQIVSHRLVSERIDKADSHVQEKPNELLHHSSGQTCKERTNDNPIDSPADETDRQVVDNGRCQRIWSKLLRTKARIMGRREFSIRKTRDSLQANLNDCR